MLMNEAYVPLVNGAPPDEDDFELGPSTSVESANFRDVSQASELTLRPGQIFRSSQNYSCCVFQVHHIKSILDLRRLDGTCGRNKSEAHVRCPMVCTKCSSEFETKGARKVKVFHVDIVPTYVGLHIMAKMPMKVWWKVARTACKGGDPAKVMCPAVANPKILGFKELYIMLLDKSRENIAEALRIFVDPTNFPILVHCVHGKDRTGVLIMLLLLLCGVPVEAVMEDYAKSEVELKECRAKNLLNMEEYLQRDEVIKAAQEDLQAALDYIVEKYGSVTAYLKKIGITKREMEQIRCNLLQGC